VKAVRDRIHKFFEGLMYKIFLNNYWSDVLERKKLDKFIKLGVGFTYFLLNVAIFFTMYFIFMRIYNSLGFEKAVLIGFVIIIAMMRVFLENQK